MALEEAEEMVKDAYRKMYELTLEEINESFREQ